MSYCRVLGMHENILLLRWIRFKLLLAAGGNHFTEMCSGSETVAYLRLIDSSITQLKAQGPSRTCNESKEVEEEEAGGSEKGGCSS